MCKAFSGLRYFCLTLLHWALTLIPLQLFILPRARHSTYLRKSSTLHEIRTKQENDFTRAPRFSVLYVVFFTLFYLMGIYQSKNPLKLIYSVTAHVSKQITKKNLSLFYFKLRYFDKNVCNATTNQMLDDKIHC